MHSFFRFNTLTKGLWNNKNNSPNFEEFKLAMNERLTNQETLLLRIAQELGLDKPKQQ